MPKDPLQDLAGGSLADLEKKIRERNERFRLGIRRFRALAGFKVWGLGFSFGSSGTPGLSCPVSTTTDGMQVVEKA